MKNDNSGNISLLERQRRPRFWSPRSIILAAFILLIEIIPVRSSAQPIANGLDKFLGCSTSSNIWPKLDQYWNQITPGNDGKWGSVEAIQGQYDWANLDEIYNYAISRGFPFKEHNLVWGNQQPSWITSLDSADQRTAVQLWIQSVCQRYDSLSFVDVVNEPFHSTPSYMNAIGGSGATGWDWVVTAFQWARQYAKPGTKLLLNDYNILQDNTVTTNYIKLIDTLKVRGLIDGIGIQGHYFEFRSPVGATSNVYVYDINTIKHNLDRIITTTGLPVYMSEFDINEPNDTVQFAQYQIYFPIFWNDPGVKGMTLWGYIQNDVWNQHPYTYLLLSNGTERPALQWLRTFVTTGPVPETPVVFSPRSTANVARKTTFVWYSSLYAMSYRLQVALDQGFSTVIIDTAATDTTATLKTPLDSTTIYYWRVAAMDTAGMSPYSAVAHFTTGTLLAVKEANASPKDFALLQNYPNPFNPTTVIGYQLPVNSLVTLKVYDIIGREVKTLVNGPQIAGSYTVRFDGGNLPSGVYFYKIRTEEYSDVKKLILIK